MATTRLNNANLLQQNQYNQNLLRQQSLGNQMSYAKLAQADPYFALGNLIGNAMSDRYNQRGVDKEMGEISNALAAYKGDQNFKAMNSVLDASGPSGVNGNVAGDTTNTINAGFPAPDVGQNEQVSNAQLANSTPSDNSIGALVDLANKGQVNKFNLDDFKAKYFEDARNRGRSNLQIQQAWANMQPQLDAMNEEAKQSRVNSVFQNIGDGNLSLNNMETAKQLNALMKDSPEVAKLLIAKAGDNDKQSALDARQNKLIAAQNARLDKSLANKIMLGNQKQGNHRNYNMSDYLAIGKAMDEMIKNNVDITGNRIPVEQWDADQRRRYNILKQQSDAMLGIQPQETNTVNEQPQNALANINEYEPLLNDVTQAIGVLSKKGYNKQEIQALIKQVYGNQIKTNGNSGYLDKILNEADWKSYNVKGA